MLTRKKLADFLRNLTRDSELFLVRAWMDRLDRMN